MAPRPPPKKEKNQKKGIFGHWGPKWLTKKIFGNFRGGVSKSMLLLTERRHIINVLICHTVVRHLECRSLLTNLCTFI